MFRKKEEGEYVDMDELQTRKQEQEFLKQHKDKLKLARKEKVKRIIEGTSKVTKSFQQGIQGVSKELKKAGENVPKGTRIKDRNINYGIENRGGFGLSKGSNKNMFSLDGLGMNPDIMSKGKRGKTKVKEFKYF